MFRKLFFALFAAAILAAPGCIYLNGEHNRQLVGKMHRECIEAQLEFDRWFFGIPEK